jgi:hypothetical protein
MHTSAAKTADTTWGRAAKVLHLLGAALAAMLTLQTSDIVQVAVTPRLSLAPSQVTMHIHIPPNSDNRELRWTCAGSTAFYITGRRFLNGIDAPPEYVHVLKALPKGEYVCDALVFNFNDEPAVARAVFAVR